MYLVDMSISTVKYSIKLFHNAFFYIGGVVLGSVFYLTGLSSSQMQSILLIILLDMITRIWAEKKNGRPIESRKMFIGFSGKIMTYLIIFTFANHAFIIGDIVTYICFGGFSFVEGRSIFENLKDAGRKEVKLISEKFEEQYDRFRGSGLKNEKDVNDTESLR